MIFSSKGENIARTPIIATDTFVKMGGRMEAGVRESRARPVAKVAAYSDARIRGKRKQLSAPSILDGRTRTFMTDQVSRKQASFIARD